MAKNLWRLFGAGLLLALCLSSFMSIANTWPSESWRSSTPEEVGMDSGLLLDMFKAIKADDINIHSVLIVRNGYLVCEGYNAPFHRDTCQNVYSVTKSVISALTGIAMKERHLSNVEQRVLPFFPGMKIQGLNAWKKEMALKHLLTMTTGHTVDSMNLLANSIDWIKTFLDLPVETQPGKKFVYDSGAPHTISAILQKKTGRDTFAYAREKLFKPLGMISNVEWSKDVTGIYNGGWGLSMTPYDMAKFGYLYLNNGVWNGKRIVPENWVRESTGGWNDPETVWPRSWHRNYGYLWWINEFGGYHAEGTGGQFIFVLPEQQMIIVITSGLEDSKMETAVNYIRRYIIPSIKSQGPIPANEEKMRNLRELLREMENPEPKEVTALPAIAGVISGKTYQLQPNYPEWSKISFTFTEDQRCWVEVTIANEKGRFEVGLDDIYRQYNGPGGATTKFKTKGFWKDDHTFVMLTQFDGWADLNPSFFTFEDNQIKMEFRSTIFGAFISRSSGKIIEGAKFP